MATRVLRTIKSPFTLSSLSHKRCRGNTLFCTSARPRDAANQKHLRAEPRADAQRFSHKRERPCCRVQCARAPAPGRTRAAPAATAGVRCSFPDLSDHGMSKEASGSDKGNPDRTGSGLLSRVANAAINCKPLFALMTAGARRMMKSTAEERGVAWSANVQELSQSEVSRIKEEIEDKSMIYPDYYAKPFHGYDSGNLNWQAAFEAEPATEVVALWVWKDEQLTPEQAHARMRAGTSSAIQGFMAWHGLSQPSEIIDVGCSVGMSTRWLAKGFPGAQVTGLDMSPYFLAVAELRERQLAGGAGQRPRIKYMHANMEATGLPDASFDLVSVQYVTHECPGHVIDSLVRECRRLLRPGGTLAVVDTNPQKDLRLRSVSPVLFTLAKSTEPNIDDYYRYDIEACLRSHGLQHVNTAELNPRQCITLGHV
ncbi:hypothetical protein ABPG75_012412 [Micractinium tetrahymenae]